MEEVGLAAAVAEAAVVEDERGDAGCGEALGEGPETVAARPGEAVGHDDDRRDRRASRRRVEPGSAGVAADFESEVLSLHAPIQRIRTDECEIRLPAHFDVDEAADENRTRVISLEG